MIAQSPTADIGKRSSHDVPSRDAQQVGKNSSGGTSVIDMGFELRFQSILPGGRELAFPCDPGGTVDLNSVSDRTRNNYLFARAMVGREYAAPIVQQLH